MSFPVSRMLRAIAVAIPVAVAVAVVLVSSGTGPASERTETSPTDSPSYRVVSERVDVPDHQAPEEPARRPAVPVPTPLPTPSPPVVRVAVAVAVAEVKFPAPPRAPAPGEPLKESPSGAVIRFSESLDNDASASWPGGIQTSAATIGRGPERLRFLGMVACDDQGACRVSFELANVSHQPMTFPGGLRIHVEVSACSEPTGDPARGVASGTAEALTPGASTTAETTISIPEPGQYCLSALVDLEA